MALVRWSKAYASCSQYKRLVTVLHLPTEKAHFLLGHANVAARGSQLLQAALKRATWQQFTFHDQLALRCAHTVRPTIRRTPIRFYPKVCG